VAAGRTKFGCVHVLLILFVPAVAASCFLDSPVWLQIVPAAIIVILISFATIANLIFPKPKLTTEQFADARERYLLGRDNDVEWENLSFRRIADQRLKPIQRELWRFDSPLSEKDKEELKALIAAIRSGSFPEIVPPRQLTYRSR
jgi:hypothetical protein